MTIWREMSACQWMFRKAVVVLLNIGFAGSGSPGREAANASSCPSPACTGRRYIEDTTHPYILFLVLPDTMAPLKIYWGSGSTPAWRVLVCMEEKGLSYESKMLQFSKSKFFYHKAFVSLADRVWSFCGRTPIALRHQARHVLRLISAAFGLSKTTDGADTHSVKPWSITVLVQWHLLGTEDSGIQDQHYET